jgi:hypothetical protein
MAVIPPSSLKATCVAAKPITHRLIYKMAIQEKEKSKPNINIQAEKKTQKKKKKDGIFYPLG